MLALTTTFFISASPKCQFAQAVRALRLRQLNTFYWTVHTIGVNGTSYKLNLGITQTRYLSFYLALLLPNLCWNMFMPQVASRTTSVKMQKTKSLPEWGAMPSSAELSTHLTRLFQMLPPIDTIARPPLDDSIPPSNSLLVSTSLYGAFPQLCGSAHLEWDLSSLFHFSLFLFDLRAYLFACLSSSLHILPLAHQAATIEWQGGGTVMALVAAVGLISTCYVLASPFLLASTVMCNLGIVPLAQ